MKKVWQQFSGYCIASEGDGTECARNLNFQHINVVSLKIINVAKEKKIGMVKNIILFHILSAHHGLFILWGFKYQHLYFKGVFFQTCDFQEEIKYI